MYLRMASSASEARRERATNKERVNDSKLRVVIVEDSPIIRARLAESLSEIPNLEITGQAESESDALALLGGGDWDAVVLDLQLKQGTGLGVLKALFLATGPEPIVDLSPTWLRRMPHVRPAAWPPRRRAPRLP